MICSSLNLECLIVRLLQPTDSTQIWRSFRGSGQKLAEFGTTAVQEASELARYVGRILGTIPEDAVGLVIGDPLRSVRTAIAAVLYERVEQILTKRGVTAAQPVSPTLAIPLIRAAYDESRPELQDLWARLLADAMDPKRGKVRLSFIDAVKHFDPLDALVLQKLFETTAELQPNQRDSFAHTFGVRPDEIEVSFINLFKLGCLNGAGSNTSLSVLGRELMRACQD